MKWALVFVFVASFLLPFFAFASIVINEVAWMGTENSANDEWIELRNTGGEPVDLSEWTLQAVDGQPSITLDSERCINITIFSGGYFLLERSDDTTVPGVAADCVYTGALSNAGEVLILKNASGIEVDRVDGSSEWVIGGNNGTKETLQKTLSGWVTAEGTPKAKNAGVSNLPSEALAQEGESEQFTQEEVIHTQGSTLGSEVGSQVTVDAGINRVVVAGAAVKFQGAAFNSKNEPITTADFLWSFGDGSLKRGRVVLHTYYYPGTYNVDLNASSGGVATLDRVVVTVIPNSIMISEVKPGMNGWIELHNDSQFDIDFSHWKIGSSKLVYLLSQNTKILAGAYVVIPYEVSGISFLSSDSAFLKYPNNVAAQEFHYNGTVKNNESFHNIQGDARLGLESPGSGRFTAQTISMSNTGYSPAETVDNLADTRYPPIETDEISTREGENLALAREIVSERERSFFSGSILWFSLALGIGLLSAIGYLFIKRKGFL